jgi:hypothetical protein
MEDFKRPNHPDFMDSSELAKLGFTGLRNNSLTNYAEVWIDGVKKLEMPAHSYGTAEWNKAYAELFGLHNVETVTEKGN